MGKDRVGKSALTVRFVSRQFIAEYDPTIEDSYRKTIRMPGAKKDHLLELLDTAGQAEFAALQNVSMKYVIHFFWIADPGHVPNII